MSAEGAHDAFSGVLQQAREQAMVAAAPCNRLRWRAPALVFHFPLGCCADVEQELQQLGVTVTGAPGRSAPLLCSRARDFLRVCHVLHCMHSLKLW